MEKSKKESASDFPCANVGCPATGRDRVNKRCAQCGAVFYCGRRCQQQHWAARGGNHRGHCKALQPSSRGPAVAAAAGVEGNAGGEPAHPCPICLDKEDDHGKHAQCFECGRQYCGDCNVPALIGQVANCPICRAPFAAPAEVYVERLLRLVARPPGRHTPEAQFNLGWMYEDGTGVPQDFTEAARLYRLAAAQGHAAAQFNLGGMCKDGTGVPQDFTEAARLYRLAAAQGHAGGQYNLGAMHHNGTGVPQDYTEAARWTRLAADQGHAQAQSNLGRMHYYGSGVPQDHTEAARLFTLACDQGYEPVRDLLGILTAKYTAGTRVRIVGMRADFGMLGTVVQPTELHGNRPGRIAVRLDGETKGVSFSWAFLAPVRLGQDVYPYYG